MQKKIALVFTGDEFAEGGPFIIKTLKENNLKASFFFTGRFYRNKSFQNTIQALKRNGHYLGAHSDEHLLYCDWNNRDSLLVTEHQFTQDLLNNYGELKKLGISKKNTPFFLPPYEWYNDTIAAWTRQLGLQLVNFSPGTLSHADYTTPDAKNYRDSKTILQSIINYEQRSTSGLNGFILLSHIGTDSKRTDKFYHQLPQLITYLKQKEYEFVRIDEMLINNAQY
jgi:endoglucanase